MKLNRSGIVRKAPLRSDPLSRFWINRSECLSRDVISFPMVLADYAGSELEVWVGEGTGDCTSREARTTISATCWRVFRGVPSGNVITVDIQVQDIAAKKKPPEHDLSIGSAEDCTSSTTAGQSITLYFMLIASLDNQAGESWVTSLDLLGPNAPAGLSIGAGSTMLRATWTSNNDTDVASYGLFCDPPPGFVADADSTFGPGPRVEAGSSTTSTCPDASVSADAGLDDAEAPDASDDATCTADASGGSGGTGSTVTACGITALARDVVPDPDFVKKYQCATGIAKASTNSIISGLTNWQPTNVAMSAVDAAGNAGPLSDVACGLPRPVNGFDEVYRLAGGTGGDGFCSIHYPGARKGHSLLAAALLAIAVLVRRRRTKTTAT
ncbi:MAG TPA: hypothetical protein VK550_06485 [Polyangiaceae bacterium]|nr:hypothetical protein [Polyangiaceae bacterium]